MEESIIFNQTRGGWRRWLPHTWHCCRTEAPGQLHPNIVIVVIIIVVIVITIVNVILISKSMEIASGVVFFLDFFRWPSVWNCFRNLNAMTNIKVCNLQSTWNKHLVHR